MSDNVYYSPEKFGLAVIKDVEWRGESYEFCQTVVWKDAEGHMYAASDSGCSCPEPFEAYRSVNDLDPVDTFDALIAHIKKAGEDMYFDWDETQVERAELVSAWQKARAER